MNLLFYIKSDQFWGVSEHQFTRPFDLWLESDNPLLMQLQPGDWIWVVTRRRKDRYLLVAKMCVRAVAGTQSSNTFGVYRVEGDNSASDVFDLHDQPDLESVLDSLSFVGGKTGHIHTFLQGQGHVRELTNQDCLSLQQAAKGLSII